MMRPGPHRPTERAFTMIEMIVVLILLALAMAAIFPAIGNMMRGSTRTSASSQASGEAVLAARLLENDIRAALGDRGTGERVAISRTALAPRVSTIPAISQRNLRMSDIRRAGPQHLYFNADVYPTVGIERVEWELRLGDPVCGDRGTTGTNWCLQRRVYSAGGAVLSLEVPTRGRGTYPTRTTNCAPGVAAINGPRVFCFQEAMPVARNGQVGTLAAYTLNQWTPQCRLQWANNGMNTSFMDLQAAPVYTTEHNRVETGTRITRLDRIVNVGASILAGGGYGKANERSYEHVEIAIRSRENEAYKEAIMCGTRAGWGR